MNIQFNFNGQVEELAFAEEEEGEAGEELEDAPPNPVIPEINHLAWALGSFLVLWALMKFVLLPPILKKREEREMKVLEDREAADRARAAVGQAQADYDASLAAARAEADSIVDAARAEAGEHRASVIGEATDEAAALRAEAAGGLDDSRAAAISSMKGDVGDIAVAAAAAVLGKDLDRGAQQSAIDAALNGDDA